MSIHDREQIEESRGQTIFVHQGATGLKHNSGYLDEEWHPKLRGKAWIKKAREMSDNSPVIGAALWIIEAVTRQATWVHEKNESGHPLTSFGVEFSEQCFADTETPWKLTVSEILSALAFGWVALEPEFKLRRGDASDPLLHSKYDDGRIGWRDFAPRSQESLERWVFDDTGRTIGMVQRDPINGCLHSIAMDRLLLFRLRSRKNNPEGRPLLRTCYRPYYKGMFMEDIESVGVERNIAGLPDYQVPKEVIEAKTPAASTALDQAKTLVKKARLDQYFGIVRPTETDREGKSTGYKFGLLSASGKSFADTGAIIQRYDTRMAQNLMTEFSMLGTQTMGSHAAHSDKTSMLGMAVNAILDMIDEIVNEQALPWLFELNNIPRDALPQRKHTDVEKREVAPVLAAVSQAVSSGAMDGDNSVNNFCRALIDLEPVEDSIGQAIQDAAVPDLSAPSLQPAAQTIAPGMQTAGAPIMPGADDLQGIVPNPEEPPDPQPDVGNDGPDYWTLEEAADNLRVSTSRLRAAIRRGQLPGLQIGNTFRLRRSEVEALFTAGQL